jgi:uncharacterized membrane protein
MFLWVQEEQGAFTARFLMRIEVWFSSVSITSNVFPYKTRTISYMHIFSIFGRLYHINCKTDMHIFSIFGRMYLINSQFFVYAFASSRVHFKLRKDCLRAIYRIVKQSISTLPLLVLFYNLSRLSDDHWWSFGSKNEVQKQVVEGRQMMRKHQLQDDDWKQEQ